VVGSGQEPSPWDEWSPLEKLFFYRASKRPEHEVPYEYLAPLSVISDPSFEQRISEESSFLSEEDSQRYVSDRAFRYDWLWQTIRGMTGLRGYDPFVGAGHGGLDGLAAALMGLVESDSPELVPMTMKKQPGFRKRRN